MQERMRENDCDGGGGGRVRCSILRPNKLEQEIFAGSQSWDVRSVTQQLSTQRTIFSLCITV